MRSDAREAVYKFVFADLFGGDASKSFRSALYRQARLSEEECAFAERIVDAFLCHKDDLAAQLSAAVTNYPDYRIYPADRAALLVAMTEIAYLDDVPPVVSVSEAVALARKYSTERSADFVNGVLGGIINQ